MIASFLVRNILSRLHDGFLEDEHEVILVHQLLVLQSWMRLDKVIEIILIETGLAL